MDGVTPDATGALLAMAQATDRQTARDRLNVAILRGLPLDQARQAMREWDEREAASVQTIHPIEVNP